MSPHSWFRVLNACAILISGIAVTPVTASSLLMNGGFEAPVQGDGNGETFNPGNTDMFPEWTVFGGDVDVADLPINPFVLYSAFEGEQVLDLNGFVRGSIYQDFVTTPGQEYKLTFAYSDNPFEGGDSTADVTVTDIGLLSDTILLSDDVTHSTATNTIPDADWMLYSDTFFAIGTTARLEFVSTSLSNSPSGGIILDDVSISAIPIPAAFPLFMSAIAGLGYLGWRRKK